MGSLNSRTALVTGSGLFAWALAQWLALGLAAGGDGWDGPFFFTLPLLLVYPVVSVRLFASEAKAARVEWTILLAAAALDLLLLFNALVQERNYFLRALHAAAEVVTTWLVLWLVWQMLAVATLVKSRLLAASIATES